MADLTVLVILALSVFGYVMARFEPHQRYNHILIWILVGVYFMAR